MIEDKLADLLEYFPILATTLGSAALWVWVVMPLAFVAFYIFVRLVIGFTFAMIRKLKRKHLFEHYIHPLQRPLTLLVATILFSATQNILPLEDLESAFTNLNIFLYTVAGTWILLVLISQFANYLQQYWSRQHKPAAVAVVPLFRKIAKSFIVVLAILFVLQNWGLDIASMLAALGIGGVAIALASQKSVENLFGGVMVSLDQPIRVGDFGKYGDTVGTVADIGMRSTRIRTLQNTLVSIPNSEFASMQIESYAPRNQILFTKKIGVVYDSSVEQLRRIQQRIQAMLEAHPKVADGPRVRLIDFADSSQLFEIWSYVDTQDWNEFLAIQEELLLSIKTIIQEAGSDFAFHSQTIYLNRVSARESDDMAASDRRSASVQGNPLKH